MTTPNYWRMSVVKTSKEYSEKFRTVQMRVEDKVQLDRVQEKTRLSRVELISEGVKLLKKRYRVKDEVADGGN